MGSKIIDVAQQLSGKQHGVVSRQQLSEAGIPSSTIQSRIESAFLFPVFPGVYLVGRPELSQDALFTAAAISAGRGAVIGGRSAAMIWGFMQHLSPMDVLKPSGGSNRRAWLQIPGSKIWPYLLIHRPVRIPSTDIRLLRGIPVTSVARTLLDLAALTTRTKFDRAFIEADRLELIEDEDLLRLASGTRGHRGGGAFRQRVEARTPDIARARSLLEGIYLDLQTTGEVPAGELNAPVLGMEVDLLWRDRRVIVELDGYEFHRGREAFERDALRGNRLKASGWSVLRVTWRMLTQRPDEVAELIVRVLRQNPS